MVLVRYLIKFFNYSSLPLDLCFYIRYNKITKNGEISPKNETVGYLWKLKEIFICKSLLIEKTMV